MSAQTTYLISAPVNEAIEYEYRTMTINETTMVGYPTPAWEEAMHKLLDGTLLRVDQVELSLVGDDSIALEDGGFAAGLGVAHNIHCVKKIKQFLYFDYFYPEVESGSSHYKYLQHHADHCLNFIRQSVMCHMDTSLYTLVWAPGEDGKDVIKHKDPGRQKCVNWNKIQSWMQSRATSTDMLRRPP
ncbi:Putative mycotoxin biosynthesis protein UstYa [Septoria linicola]|uniref:Mycotoxin biosynthesis protein UstYa n=1 Tax=Septoria linicola TaxID=215465 RepID=A0A9Q9AUA1_9PEZI|nr:Putative mycotoxin biosynthesis protein UstYa [Septoria linicola]